MEWDANIRHSYQHNRNSKGLVNITKKTLKGHNYIANKNTLSGHTKHNKNVEGGIAINFNRRAGKFKQNLFLGKKLSHMRKGRIRKKSTEQYEKLLSALTYQYENHQNRT